MAMARRWRSPVHHPSPTVPKVIAIFPKLMTRSLLPGLVAPHPRSITITIPMMMRSKIPSLTKSPIPVPRRTMRFLMTLISMRKIVQLPLTVTLPKMRGQSPMILIVPPNERSAAVRMNTSPRTQSSMD